MDTIVLRIDQPQPGGNYRVVLIGDQESELGQAEFPSGLALPGMVDVLTAKDMHEIFAQTTSESDDLARIGAQLYALIGQGAIHAELDPDGDARRLLLQIEPPELRSLPWELLVRDGAPLLNSVHRPICRGSLRAAPLVAAEWPLRVLIIDGGEAAGENVVQAREEISRIIQVINDNEAAADIDLLVLSRPSREQILQAFEDPPDLERYQPHQGFKPHIFHFIGHGDVGADNRSFLQLWDKEGQLSTDWYAEDIRTDFMLPHKPRLVILNACKSAGAASDGLWSVTDAFLKANVSAVIGMRANISGEHARLFSSGLYRALAQGKPLDEAVVMARLQVWRNSQNASKRLEWAAPTLEVRVNPASVIAVGEKIDSHLRLRVLQSSELSKVRGLVDRRPERSGAWRRVSEDQRRVVVVRGNEGVGKTAFVHLLMERCALCNHQIRYVDLAGTTKIDVLTVLRRICDGASSASDDLALTGPLPAAAFQPFKNTVQQILGAPLSPESNWSTIQEAIDRKRIFESFQKGLEQSIITPPLVLVLDHLQDIHEDQVRSFLIPDLVTWCARRPDRNLLLVLLLRGQDYANFGLEQARSNFRLIDIDGFSKHEWKELAWEFVWRNLKPPAHGDGSIEQLDELITTLGKTAKETWEPASLRDFGAIVKSFLQWTSR